LHERTLEVIKALLAEPRGARQKERWRKLVDEKLDELDYAARRLRAMKRVLAVSRDCDCVDVEQCAAICRGL
jgi:hypothetical protein